MTEKNKVWPSGLHWPLHFVLYVKQRSFVELTFIIKCIEVFYLKKKTPLELHLPLVIFFQRVTCKFSVQICATLDNTSSYLVIEFILFLFCTLDFYSVDLSCKNPLFYIPMTSMKYFWLCCRKNFQWDGIHFCIFLL